VATNGYFIGGHFIVGYCKLYLLVSISGYFIVGYWWLFYWGLAMVILL
jgi:hypothetical protein